MPPKQMDKLRKIKGRKGFLFQAPQSKGRFFCLPGDLVSDETIMFGAFENDRLQALRRILKIWLGSEKCTVIDVGAHFGLYCAELAEFAVQSYAIEPQPALAKICEANALLRNYKCEVIQAGVGDKLGQAQLVIKSAGNLGSNTLAMVADAKPGHTIEVTTLDHLFADKQRVLSDKIFLKIDVEQMEVLVLQGALQFIKQHQPLVHIELMGDVNAEFQAMVQQQLPDYQILVLDDVPPAALTDFHSDDKKRRKIGKQQRYASNHYNLYPVNELPVETYFEGVLLLPKTIAEKIITGLK